VQLPLTSPLPPGKTNAMRQEKATARLEHTYGVYRELHEAWNHNTVALASTVISSALLFVATQNRSSRFRSFPIFMFRWCAYGAPARLTNSTSWISCFATTRWSVVTLDPGKMQMNILLLADTTIEGASPSHARQE
jgi:hypothetical protein